MTDVLSSNCSALYSGTMYAALSTTSVSPQVQTSRSPAREQKEDTCRSLRSPSNTSSPKVVFS